MPDFPKLMSPREFEHPNLIDQNTINVVYLVRIEVNRPFYFSRPHHPGGDARFYDDNLNFSLHTTGIDHSKSKREGRPIFNSSYLCKAIDFHCKTTSPEDFCNLALWISQILKETYPSAGLGIYPMWSQPGFHIDTRDKNHPSKGARWWAQYKDDRQQYHQMGNKMSYQHLKIIEEIYGAHH